MHEESRGGCPTGQLVLGGVFIMFDFEVRHVAGVLKAGHTQVRVTRALLSRPPGRPECARHGTEQGWHKAVTRLA